MQFHCVYSIPFHCLPLQFIYVRVAVYCSSGSSSGGNSRTSSRTLLQMEDNTIAVEDVRLFCQLEHRIKYSSDQKSIKCSCLLFLLTTLCTCSRTTATPYRRNNSQCSFLGRMPNFAFCSTHHSSAQFTEKEMSRLQLQVASLNMHYSRHKPVNLPA